ncbi:hypothetical protein [Sinorhizobium meliloti]|uniref:hypothetical protein n=1 Tax=Rhizobium meliloti TaxID=382 RepID=UPI00398CCE11
MSKTEPKHFVGDLGKDVTLKGKNYPEQWAAECCKAVIAQITFADLGRGAGTLHTVGADTRRRADDCRRHLSLSVALSA